MGKPVLAGLAVLAVLAVLAGLVFWMCNHEQRALSRVESSAVQPAHFEQERGLIVCAGGSRNLEAFGGLAWLRELERRAGAPPLEVEWFHVGDAEVSPAQREFIAGEIGHLRFRDVAQMYPRNPGLLKGFPIKAFALAHSGFRHAILLDSDCVPVRNPADLLASPGYAQRGNIFWSDFDRPLRPRLAGLRFKNDPAPLMGARESESGQLLVDRARHQDALFYAWKLNEESKVFYRRFYGDKDLFAVGFLVAGKAGEFNQAPHLPLSLKNERGQHEAIAQLDPADAGRVYFVHRTHQKRNCLSGSPPCLLEVDRGYVEMDGARPAEEVLDALRFVQAAERRALERLGN